MRPCNDEKGDWRGLDSPTQAPRYVAIAEILHGFKANGSVLDVGCGEALLRTHLPKATSYTGIERSATAAQIAIERNASTIVHTEAESFDPLGERFDSIVFNEMLYYLADPVGLLRKYAAFLRPGGAILCSVFQKPGEASLKSRLWHWIDHRRPLSAVHCAKMVRGFMTREGWSILDDRAVTIPGTSLQWHIWLATPDSILSLS